MIIFMNQGYQNSRDKETGIAPDKGIVYDKELRKVLSRWELLYLSLGGVIGSGWLFAALYAASYAGAAAILSWIIGGLLMLTIGLAYAEISSAIPKSGGLVRYAHYTHGGVAGFLMAWAYLLSAATTAPTEALASTNYLTYLVPQISQSQIVYYSVVILFMIFYGLLNYLGVKVLGTASHLTGWWKLIVPAVTGFILVSTYFNALNLTAGGGFIPTTGTAPYVGWTAILYAIPAAGIVFSYSGFRQSIEYAGEGRNPQRDIPFAVVGTLLIALLLYAFLQTAFIGALDWSRITVSGVAVAPGNWTALPNSNIASSPYASIITYIAEIKPLLAPILGIIIIVLLIDAVISPMGTGWIYTGTTTRSLYGLAANGYLPEMFMKLGKTKVPTLSLIVGLIIGGLFLLPFPTWQAIVTYEGSATVLTYMMGGIGLEALRRTAPELNRPFKLKGASIIAPIATAAAGLVVYWAGFATLSMVVVSVFAGLPLFLGYYGHKMLGLSEARANALGWGSAIVIALSLWYLYSATNGLSAPNDVAFWTFIVALSAAVGLGLLFMYRAVRPEAKLEIKAGLWLPAYMITMLIISYYGPFGLNTVIPFPWDTLLVAAVTVVFHYIAVAVAVRTKAIDEIIRSIV